MRPPAKARAGRFLRAGALYVRDGRSGPHPVEPLYTSEDAEKSIKLFRTTGYGEAEAVVPGIAVTFREAGHILGSALLSVALSEGSEETTIVFSGDLGRWDVPILRNPTVLERADYVVTESTYGNRVHEDSTDSLRILEDVVCGAHEAGGNVVVPSFAIGRTQELLYYLNELSIADRIPHVPVFVDSPMAIRVTEVFKRHPELYDAEMRKLMDDEHSPFAFSNLHMTSSVNQSKAINHIRGTAIIIAGSGMCTGGRIKHHLVHNISRPESTVLFVGYQAAGTLGREIVTGADSVRIFGSKHNVRARIRQVNGFSAHADREELQRWIRGFGSSPRRVFVTHGEEEVATSYADLLRTEHRLDAVAPEYEQEFPLS